MVQDTSNSGHPAKDTDQPVILAIETSCDETAAAVVRGRYEVLSSVVATQFDVHAKYAGVVPELASRAHIENMDGVIQEALAQAGVDRQGIDAIAVSYRPGLVGCLLIGVTAAKTLAMAWSKPLIGVNHVHAHACSAAIEAPIPEEQLWPAVALVVSGGHTSLLNVRGPMDIELLGSTIDDAAGEAFDKVASILNLGFPGGPRIEKAAAGGNPKACDFPRTLLGRDSLDFSFSGIKTAVLYHVHGPGKTTGGLERLSPQDIADITASFQTAVVDVLVTKAIRAAQRTKARNIVVGGGVAANKCLRETLLASCRKKGIGVFLPSLRYCTDNAVMIAAQAMHLYAAGQFAPLDIEPRSTM